MSLAVHYVDSGGKSVHELDLEVINVLLFQQMIDAVEKERWDEAAMSLYKLYAIEEGERFADLHAECSAEVDAEAVIAA